MPPGFEGSFGCRYVDGQGAVGVEGAGEVHAEVLARAEGERFAVVLVEGAVAVAASVDAEGEGAVGGLLCALGERRDGEDRSLADVDGQVGEFGRDHDGWDGYLEVALFEIAGGGFFAAVEAFAGPVVVPDAGWKVDFVGGYLFRGG